MRISLKVVDEILHWSLVGIPFSIAFGPGFTNTLIIFLVLSFLIKRIATRQGLSLPLHVWLPFLCMGLCAFLSFANTIDLRASWQGIGKIAYSAWIFIICAEELRDTHRLRQVIVAITIGAVISSLDAFWQMGTGRDFIRGWPPMDFIGFKRATAAFPHTNILGVYLSACAPLIVGVGLFFYKGAKRFWMLLAGVMSSVALGLTYSRGAAAGLLISVLYICFARRNYLIPIVFFALLCVFPFMVRGQILPWMRAQNYDPVRIMLSDDRLIIYRNSVNMIRHHPFIGVGVNTFSQNYKRYKLPDPAGVQSSDSMYAHNNFLHMAGEIGLLGAACFVWFLIALSVYARRAYRRIADDEYLRVSLLALTACLLSFLINGLTETSLYYSRVCMIFWYMAGVVISYGKSVART